MKSLLGSAAQQLPGAVDQYFSKISQNRQEEAANAAAKRLGIDTTGLDPETRRALLVEKLRQGGAENLQGMKGEQLSQRNQADQFQEDQSYGKIKEAFGEKFANIWKAAPVGGKTELLKQGIDARLRGANVDQLLEGVQVPESISNEKELSPLPQMKDGQVPKELEWPDFTKRPGGYSPKDWIDERKTWRKENSPVFLENKTNLKNSKRDELDYNRLESLSEKLPEGLERIVINPQTGEPYGVAQLTGKVSPSVQEWIKIISRFQNRAKDAFGSRVTNFDLMSYMKQFPGLLNNKEGRRRIIDLMKINNKLDGLYENSLNKVYQKYGLSGIPQEEADKLAQSLIQNETEKLNQDYLNIDNENIMNQPTKLSGRLVDVTGPDGQIYEIDESEIELLPPGFKL